MMSCIMLRFDLLTIQHLTFNSIQVTTLHFSKLLVKHVPHEFDMPKFAVYISLCTTVYSTITG